LLFHFCKGVAGCSQEIDMSFLEPMTRHRFAISTFLLLAGWTAWLRPEMIPDAVSLLLAIFLLVVIMVSLSVLQSGAVSPAQARREKVLLVATVASALFDLIYRHSHVSAETGPAVFFWVSIIFVLQLRPAGMPEKSA
jgi:hypothetical protein